MKSTASKNEVWEKWIPSQKISGKYKVNLIDDNVDVFSVSLSSENNEGKNIKINFFDSIDIYQGKKIEYFQKDLEQLKAKHGSNFFKEWSFYKIQNSASISWLKDESYDSVDFSYFHFAIIGSNYILEIIANYEPKIEIIKT